MSIMKNLLHIESLERIIKEMMSYDAHGEYLIDTRGPPLANGKLNTENYGAGVSLTIYT